MRRSVQCSLGVIAALGTFTALVPNRGDARSGGSHTGSDNQLAGTQSPLFNIRRYSLVRVEAPVLAYTQFPKNDPNAGPQDSLGVPLFNYKGTNYYHPVAASWRGLQFLDNYNFYHNSIFLRRAETIARELVKRAARSRGGLYYPYDFDFEVLALESETMRSPWYSGMAEGRMLSLLIRLYRTTGKQEYRAWADSTFTTFSNYPDGTNAPWTVFVDKDRFYWIEEYPHPSGGNMVLNGHAFGIYGLYDYAMLTGDERAKTFAQAAITTYNQYIPVIRNPGGASLYSIKHRYLTPNYHLTSIQNLNYMAAITGDDGFAKLRDLFMADQFVAGSFTRW
jgi:hypothetical protein